MLQRMCRWLAALCAMLGAITAPADIREAKSQAEIADVAVVLAVDVSNSIDAKRYRLQMDGIAETFEDPDVLAAILSDGHRSVLVSLVEWSNTPRMTVPWTLLTSNGDAIAFAAKVRNTRREAQDFTCMSKALGHIYDKVLPLQPVPAARVIIDVSGDGRDNCNAAESVSSIRDRLASEDVTVNGLPILEGEESATLVDWYRQNVVGGPGAFLIPANGFSDFKRAMRLKFVTEISRARRDLPKLAAKPAR